MSVEFEDISFNVEDAGRMTLDEFITAGVNYGWYVNYGLDGQHQLLQKAYELIQEQYVGRIIPGRNT